MKHLTVKQIVEWGYLEALKRGDVAIYIDAGQVIDIEASPNYYVLVMNDENGESDPLLAVTGSWYLRVVLSESIEIKGGYFKLAKGAIKKDGLSGQVFYYPYKPAGNKFKLGGYQAVLWGEDKAQVDRALFLLREFT